MLTRLEVNCLCNLKSKKSQMETSTKLELPERNSDDGHGKIVIPQVFNRLAAHFEGAL